MKLLIIQLQINSEKTEYIFSFDHQNARQNREIANKFSKNVAKFQ
jgi:hypothetical protein